MCSAKKALEKRRKIFQPDFTPVAYLGGEADGAAAHPMTDKNK